MRAARIVQILECSAPSYLLCLGLLTAGCAPLPVIKHQPQYHNPFPQLQRVAILPFYNLSSEPTVNQDDVAEAYYNELQKIRGFEVMPPGVVRQWLQGHGIAIDGATDFQMLARQLGVDTLIRGAVTEYSPYYPPRIGLAVDWYAANPSFHPIPPGYGLPWGTPDEEYIPESLVFEAELALAREQLKTQTPDLPDEPRQATEPNGGVVQLAADQDAKGVPPAAALPEVEDLPGGVAELSGGGAYQLPPNWPDPRGFVPRPPSPVPPPYRPQHKPVITHTRLYHGDDEQLTKRLEDYCFFRDNARVGGWKSYLLRSDDFIRFCCHLHIAETLAARGGSGKTRVVWRWPIGRYDVGTGKL